MMTEEVQQESARTRAHRALQDDAQKAMTWFMRKVAFNHQISKMIFQVPTKNSSTGEPAPSMHPVRSSSLGHVDES